MKRVFTILILFGLLSALKAHPVDRESIHSIAAKFMGTNSFHLAATYKTDKNDNALFVFNTENGFVIVAADDCETPIIAYSHESQFNPDNVPVQMEEYLQNFVKRIQYGIENHVMADDVTARQWALVMTTGKLNDQKTDKAVAPLITTRWHQGCLYNSLCPTITSQPCGHAEVGCVAVAMGQIMNYWKFPQVGFGFHSYTSTYGTLSADFANTTYDWEHMAEVLTDTSSNTEVDAVATLLYHCGVSVNMFYTPTGSVARSLDVTEALTNYFKYSRNIRYEKRCDDNAVWLAKLKQSLDSLQPVYYSGNGNANHAFVCDGYDSNDMLHFNWGWGGNGDGYFSLGNLNPLGYTFNDSHTAIFNIIPHHDPYSIGATTNPPIAGIVTGTGDYLMGDTCYLTALPAENCVFLYWKEDGEIVSNNPTYPIIVENHHEMEACFSFKPAIALSAIYAPDATSPSCPYVNLSWENNDNEEWHLLKQFQVKGEIGGIATDGNHIYITYAAWNETPSMFEQYTMDGDLVDSFDIEGIPNALCLTYDGTDFYCNYITPRMPLYVLYRIDVDHHTVIDSIPMDIWFGAATYDPEYDGFWLFQDYDARLYDRQGEKIMSSPKVKDYLYGAGYHISPTGNPHLLLLRESGIYDYDIVNNFIFTRPLLSLDPGVPPDFGACTGLYNGKDAMFFSIGNTVRIYEIRSRFVQDAPISYYRIYRSDDAGHIVMLADEVTSYTYSDTEWNDLPNGTYRFGISSVFANGSESEIVWSNTLEKTNHGIEENLDSNEPDAQKIYENGQIVIIKDGKKYNIAGQLLR